MRSTSEWIPIFLIKRASTYSFAGGIFVWLTEQKVNHITLPSHSFQKREGTGSSLFSRLGCPSGLLCAVQTGGCPLGAPWHIFLEVFLVEGERSSCFCCLSGSLEITEWIRALCRRLSSLSLWETTADVRIPAPLGRSSNCSCLLCIYD